MKYLLLILFPFLLHSQIDDNKIVTYKDLKWLIDNEGFQENNSFSYTDLRCVTKQQALNSLRLQEVGVDLANYDWNQLVPRIVLIPDNYNLLCDFDITTATPNEENVTTGWNKATPSSVIGIGAPYDGVGSLYLTSSSDDVYVQSASKDYPLVYGRNYELSFYVKKTVGISQLVEIPYINESITNITSTWTKYTYLFTSNINNYFSIDIISRSIKNEISGDNIFIDKIFIKEYPYDLYPTGNAASKDDDESNSLGSWEYIPESESETVLQTSAPGTNGSYSIRCGVNTTETFPVTATTSNSIMVKDGRELLFEFDAKANISSTGGATFDILISGLSLHTETITSGNTWNSYSFTVTPNIWGEINLLFEIGGHNQDFLEFDNFRITQLPCN